MSVELHLDFDEWNNIHEALKYYRKHHPFKSEEQWSLYIDSIILKVAVGLRLYEEAVWRDEEALNRCL